MSGLLAAGTRSPVVSAADSVWVAYAFGAVLDTHRAPANFLLVWTIERARTRVAADIVERTESEGAPG